MKKFIILCSLFLFISFSMNIVTTTAQPSQTFSEGVYKITDVKLLPNAIYKVQNISPYKAFMSIYNGDQMVEQSIRLEPNSIKYVLKPMKADYRIVILGNGQLSFTT